MYGNNNDNKNRKFIILKSHFGNEKLSGTGWYLPPQINVAYSASLISAEFTVRDSVIQIFREGMQNLANNNISLSANISVLITISSTCNTPFTWKRLINKDSTLNGTEVTSSDSLSKINWHLSLHL